MLDIRNDLKILMYGTAQNWFHGGGVVLFIDVFPQNNIYFPTTVDKGDFECIKVSSYIAWYPVLGTVQSALHFTSWQTCSFQRQVDFSGKNSAML